MFAQEIVDIAEEIVALTITKDMIIPRLVGKKNFSIIEDCLLIVSSGKRRTTHPKVSRHGSDRKTRRVFLSEVLTEKHMNVIKQLLKDGINLFKTKYLYKEGLVIPPTEPGLNSSEGEQNLE
jgi:hypothetical protein